MSLCVKINLKLKCPIVSPSFVAFVTTKQNTLFSPSGSQAKELNSKPGNTATVPPVQNNNSAPAKKKVGINEPQICRNKGCGQTFKEKDNHDNACSFHPGPAVFHDRMRGVCIP